MKSDYPFVLPYLEVLNRLMEVSNMLKKIVMWNAWHNIGVWVVLKFAEYLKKLADTNEVMNSYDKIKRIWEWFEEIRKVLRVSREFSEKEQNNLPTTANEIEPKFWEIILKIREEGWKLGGDFIEISKRICENCLSHLDELFVKVNDQV